MLRSQSHNVRLRHAGGGYYSLERQVVGLRSAAGEYDVARVGSRQIGDPPAGRFHRTLGLPSKAVRATGGIAEFFPKERQHRIQHAWIHRCGGMVIEIDGFCHCFLTVGGALHSQV